MAQPVDVQLKDPLWQREDIIQKCLDGLEATNGPVAYKSGEIKNYDPQMALVIPKERPCIIKIRNVTGDSVTNGLGCYYGNGHVLTALHVIQDAGLEMSQTLIAFPAGEIMLVYKAVFTESSNKDKDRDQAFIRILGDSRPLGDGLQNHIGKMIKKGNVYFYTLASNGDVLKQEGQICRPHLKMKAQMCTDEFIISVAGNRGDSGSAVYNTNGELIGIYRGSFTSRRYQYGRCSIISPHLSLGSKQHIAGLALRGIMHRQPK